MPNLDKDKKLKGLAAGIMVVSFFGFIDSAYLTINHFTGVTLPCTITHGCDIVTRSQYSELFGIPVAAFGIIYYLTIFFGAYIYLETRVFKSLRLTAMLTICGALFSSWLVYVQLGILHAICQYCMLSAVSSLTLFGLGLWVFKTSSLSQSPNATVPEPPESQTP